MNYPAVLSSCSTATIPSACPHDKRLQHVGSLARRGAPRVGDAGLGVHQPLGPPRRPRTPSPSATSTSPRPAACPRARAICSTCRACRAAGASSLSGPCARSERAGAWCPPSSPCARAAPGSIPGGAPRRQRPWHALQWHAGEHSRPLPAPRVPRAPLPPAPASPRTSVLNSRHYRSPRRLSACAPSPPARRHATRAVPVPPSPSAPPDAAQFATSPLPTVPQG